MSKLRDVGNQEEMMAKDKAEERRIFREMLSGMTTAERNSLITKDKLFPPIHYQAESEKGKDRTVLYFMKKVRDALPPRPNIPNIPYGASAEAKEQIIRTAQDKYIDMISGYCDLIQELDSLEDCRNFPNRVKEEGVSTTLPKSRDTYKLTKAICCANDTVSFLESRLEANINAMERKSGDRLVLKMSPQELSSPETLEKMKAIEPLGTGLKLPPMEIEGKEQYRNGLYVKKNPSWKKVRIKADDTTLNIPDWSYSPASYPQDSKGNIKILAEVGLNSFNGQSVELTAKFDRSFQQERQKELQHDKPAPKKGAERE